MSWLPVDTAAAAIVDLRHAREDIDCVHILHPKPVPWSSIISEISESLHVPVVPYVEWFGKLSDALAEPALRDGTPACRLFDFFERALHSSPGEGGPEDKRSMGEAFDERKYAMEVTGEVCRVLGKESVEPISGEDVKKWLEFWERTWRIGDTT